MRQTRSDRPFWTYSCLGGPGGLFALIWSSWAQDLCVFTWVPRPCLRKDTVFTWVPRPCLRKDTVFTWVPRPCLRKDAVFTWVPRSCLRKEAVFTSHPRRYLRDSGTLVPILGPRSPISLICPPCPGHAPDSLRSSILDIFLPGRPWGPIFLDLPPCPGHAPDSLRSLISDIFLRSMILLQSNNCTVGFAPCGSSKFWKLFAFAI